MPGVSVIVPGTPGMRSAVTAQPRVIFRQAEPWAAFAQGRLIDGANARDTSNTGDTDRLQAGCVMGKIAASGLYANSFFGVTLGTSSANGTAYTSGGTSICVSPAAAPEIGRRIGQSGHLIWGGPPSAAGTVAARRADRGRPADRHRHRLFRRQHDERRHHDLDPGRQSRHRIALRAGGQAPARPDVYPGRLANRRDGRAGGQSDRSVPRRAGCRHRRSEPVHLLARRSEHADLARNLPEQGRQVRLQRRFLNRRRGSPG